jgi:putative aldouronate transport system substrate-binding protein
MKLKNLLFTGKRLIHIIQITRRLTNNFFMFRLLEEDKMRINSLIAGIFFLPITITLAGCGDSTKASTVSDENVENGETITVSLGRQTTANPKFPDGDTYEDNAYIRMCEEELNIDIIDAFEAESGDDYDRQVSLALSAGDIPDIMKVGSLDELTELYENDLIADLTEVYENNASDYIKNIYDSFEGRALDNVTYDGKIMALPATSSDSGASMCWIRKDWADEKGIQIDEDGDRCITISEVRDIAKQFIEANPENVENMVGIAYDSSLTSGSSDGTNNINAICYAMGAYPRLWYKNEKGELIYGSTTPEMREALRVVSEWYSEGIIDSQLGTRTWDDITSLMTNGQAGIIFGAWHIPDWMLNNVYALNNKAVFEPYAVVDDNGKVNCTHANATSGYIVVSKDFAHPEIAVKIANLFYDEMVNSDELLEKYPEVKKYLNDGVDGTARPFNIEVKSSSYLLDEYSQLKAALEGKASKEDISTAEERANYDSIVAFNEGNGDVTGWCKSHSRCKGVDLLKYLTENDYYNWITPVYPETTPTMNTNWANLQTLEEETFIKIVTGAEDIDTAFDTYVDLWFEQGGEAITSEINEQLEQ